jgi:hypothetical protein
LPTGDTDETGDKRIMLDIARYPKLIKGSSYRRDGGTGSSPLTTGGMTCSMCDTSARSHEIIDQNFRCDMCVRNPCFRIYTPKNRVGSNFYTQNFGGGGLT